MDTREAIEKVRGKYEGWMGYARTQEEVDGLEKERDGIIKLLQEGEENKKYKEAWEEFKEINGSVWGYGKGKYVRELMEEFEQKRERR